MVWVLCSSSEKEESEEQDPVSLKAVVLSLHIVECYLRSPRGLVFRELGSSDR